MKKITQISEKNIYITLATPLHFIVLCITQRILCIFTVDFEHDISAQ